MVRALLDKTICPAWLALGYEAGDLGSSPSWANIFLLYLWNSFYSLFRESLLAISRLGIRERVWRETTLTCRFFFFENHYLLAFGLSSLMKA